MKRLIVILLIVIFSFVMVACGSSDNTPVSGYVQAKSYDDPDDYNIQGSCLMWIDMGKGMRICSLYQQIPMHDEAHWNLELNNSRKDKQGWVEVTQETYHKCHIGEWCRTS